MKTNFLIPVSLFLSTTLLLCALNGCGGSKTTYQPTTGPLPQGYINPEFTPIPSYLSIPIALQPAFLENLINTQIKDTLYRNDTLKIIPGINIAQLKVLKADKVHIGLLGDELHYRIPLKLWLRVGVGVDSWGMRLFQDLDAGIALRIRSVIKINPNWSVSTQTVIDGYDWISDPVIKIAGLTIPFKPAADLVLTFMKGYMGRLVDKSVQSNLDLHAMLSPLWEQIQKPIPVNDSLQLWLMLSPDSITMSQLRGFNGCIVSSISIKTVAQTFWGTAPATDTIRPLPQLVISDTIRSGFILNLYSEMSFTQAQTLARRMLCGKVFDVGGRKIGVDNIWFNGDSGLIKVDASLSGAFKGTVTLVGQPYLDTSSRIFSVQDVTFDMKTGNVLLLTAKWLLNGLLQRKIAEFLKFPLDQEIVKSKDLINVSLGSYKPYNNISFAGRVDSLSIRGFAMTGNSVRVSALVTGKLGVKLEALMPFF